MSSYASRLEPAIRQILSQSDLTTVGVKAVRKALIARGENSDTIKERKEDIDEITTRIFGELTEPDYGGNSSPEEPLTAGSSSSTAFPTSSLPQPLTKKIKREEKPDIKPGRVNGDTTAAFDDEAYARQLQAEFDGHTSRASRSAASGSGKKSKSKKAVVKKKEKRSSEMIGSDDENGMPKKKRGGGGGGAFNKELILSDELAALVGEPRLSRPQTVKRIWDYVKERDLQDATDRRYIICDDLLQRVFHTDRLHMFTMNKLLVKHFMDPEEVILKKDEPFY